jgi:hypothetical protein
MMASKLSLERLLVVLGGLALAGCDKKPDSPQAEPAPSASAAPVAVAAPPPAPSVSAKEVTPSTSASGGKEKKCAPGGCAPGACG